MPYNRLEDELPLPMLLDMSEQRPNKYKRNSKFTRTFETITIDHGEHKPLDPKTEKTVHFRPVISNDARLRTVSLPMRNSIYMLQIPWDMSYVNSDSEAQKYERRLSLLFAMMTNKQNTLKHGYITQFGGFRQSIDTITILTDAIWELVAEGAKERATVLEGSATYTENSGKLPRPPGIPDRPADTDAVTKVIRELTPEVKKTPLSTLEQPTTNKDNPPPKDTKSE